MLKELIINTDGSLRGSFINALITFVYLVLIVIGVFYEPVRAGIQAQQTFMTWFFATSFGLWIGKKTVEIIVDGKTTKVSSDN
jgi:hypothetical protein